MGWLFCFLVSINSWRRIFFYVVVLCFFLRFCFFNFFGFWFWRGVLGREWQLKVVVSV